MRADLIAAYRALGASKTFTAVAVIVLALGIGATSAVYSVVDAVVLRGLPYDEHDRLVALGEQERLEPGGPPSGFSTVAPQTYLDWAQQQDVFDAIAAISNRMVTVHEPGGEAEELVALRTTASFFPVLRLSTALGRPFTTEHEVDGRDKVAVLGHGLWARRYGADPEIIGRTITLDGIPHEVLGVLPPGATFPPSVRRQTDLYVPFVVPAHERIRQANGYSLYLEVIGRLKPGVSFATARARMTQVHNAILVANPGWANEAPIALQPLHDYVVGTDTRPWMFLLLGAAGVVLIIACVNVAILQLARASTREHEMGVRLALGGGRWRLMRQLLVENIALAAVAATFAAVCAAWLVDVLRGALPLSVPRVSDIQVDMQVFAATAGVALLAGIVTGLIPAMQLSTPGLALALKDRTRSLAGDGARRWRFALVASEVALALVLLVGASLFTRSFASLMRVDLGFEPTHVLTASVFPRIEPASRTPPVSIVAELRAVLDRIRTLPDVRSASLVVGTVPLSGSSSRIEVTAKEPPHQPTMLHALEVSAEYHTTLGVPIVRGRPLLSSDEADGAERVAVLNESAARTLFGAADAVGRVVVVGSTEYRVVGIATDVRQQGPEAPSAPEINRPIPSRRRGGAWIVVRTTGDPTAVLPLLREAVAQTLPAIPLRNVHTLEEVVARFTAERRFNALLMSAFGMLGLLIAAVGLYGTLAYDVERRTREIGVRMALGASVAAVVRLVLGEGARVLVTGLVGGLVLASWASRSAEAYLFQVTTRDPWSFAVAPTVLALAALAACLVPIRRATRVSPAEALRVD